MASNWNKDIKGVPTVKGVNSGHAKPVRVLSISSASTGSGVRVAKSNKYGRQ